MPSIINAATSGGLISTADTSGVLQLQTASTTALTISAAQVVTIAKDAVIDGLTVGQGGGNVATNTSVGASGLNANTTGAFNTAIGAQALQANTTASNNTAVGYQAGYSGTTVANNVAVGHQALYTNSTGSGRNTAVGNVAGTALTTASECAFFGDFAGFSVTTGGGNVFLGRAAGYQTTTGVLNTFVGPISGGNMTTGSRNTIIGAYNGQQGILDIRTESSYIVLSDGDGNVQFTAKNGNSWALPNATIKSGTGITFPATQSASSDANTLDDYEEGTFTPSLTGSSGSPIVGSNVCSYVKIGRMVSVTMNFTVNKNTAAGPLSIVGLPFVVESSYYPQGVMLTDFCSSTYDNPIVQFNSASTECIPIIRNGSTVNHDQAPWSAWGSSNFTLRVSATYRTS